MTQYLALTAYNVQIPKSLPSRKAAMSWAEEHGEKWPGARIVQKTARGLRTVWRWTPPEGVRA